MAKDKARKIIMHIIAGICIVSAILFGVFYFGKPIAHRFVQTLKDVWNSFAAYVTLLFTGADGAITPTVQIFPEDMDAILPLTWEELLEALYRFWDRFTNWKIILSYLWMVFEKIALALSWISLFILPAFLIGLLIFLIYRKKDTRHNEDTRPLRGFKKMRDRAWIPFKGAVFAFNRFMKRHWWYLLVMALIWAYNVNILAIANEVLAYLFYVSWAGDFSAFSNILIQAAKLAVDLTVVQNFIPGWIWFLIGYKLLDIWRKHIGRNRLKKCIEADMEFIDKYPGALFVTGKQRSKKTSMLTMLKILFERRFREAADKRLLQRDAQFPFFPWINLEKFIQRNRSEHKIFMLYHCRKFIRKLRTIHALEDTKRRARYLALLKKEYGYGWDDCFFGYDTSYGLEYNDGLTHVHLFEAMEMYSQLFFIYSQTSPLDLSNLSIREDFTWRDHGNFPVFDGDLLGRDAGESTKASKYSHVIDFDAFRPGLKFDPDNPNRDAVEYGIGVVQEVDKERKNSKTRAASGNKADGELGIATQDNDGFEIDLKVRGQVALVDFYDFWVWLIDAQRVGDLGASNADLTNQVFIKGRAKEALKIPFFEVEETLFGLVTAIYNKIHRFFRSRKGSNTLFHHLIKLAYEPIWKAHDRVEKEFTVWKLDTKVTDGGDNEELGRDGFWILSYVTYRARFASDVCKAFYEYRFARSKRGIDDIPCYTAIETDVKMMMAQNSYFTEDMTVYNGIESRRKRKEQRGKRGTTTKKKLS